MKSKLRAFLALAGILATAGAAEAGTITVQNFSFENPSYSSGGGLDSPGGRYSFQATGWNTGGTYSGSFLPNDTAANLPVPDGNQVGFAGDITYAGSLFQDLGVAVVAGESYTLDVYVGSRLEGYPANYSVELLAGGTVLGSTSGTIDPGTGNFFPVTVTAIATGANSGNLGILLSQTASGGQSLFDDVRLTSAPEPSTLLLAASGLFALPFSRHLRRRTGK